MENTDTHPTFFTAIGDAIAKTYEERCLSTHPYSAVLHIDSWETPNPRLGLWPANYNPEPTWNSGKTSYKWKAQLVTVDVIGSHKTPQSWYEKPEDRARYPMIHMSRVDSSLKEMFQSDPFAGRYFPEAGLASIWQSMVDTPEVSIDLCYRMTRLTEGSTTDGSTSDWHLHLLGRFSEEAQKVQGFKNLNDHLLKNPPPESWSTVYPQKGKKEALLPQGKKPRKRTKNVDTSFLVEKKENSL
jgi:hypothetical protein